MASKIYCNKCGRLILPFEDYVSVPPQAIGYGSKFDGGFVDMDVCYGCFDGMVSEWAIPPVVGCDEEDLHKE